MRNAIVLAIDPGEHVGIALAYVADAKSYFSPSDEMYTHPCIEGYNMHFYGLSTFNLGKDNIPESIEAWMRKAVYYSYFYTDWEEAEPLPIFCVVEQYVMTRNSMYGGSKYALEVIGMVKSLIVATGLPIQLDTRQRPAAAKNIAPNETLRLLHAYKRGDKQTDHALMAARHAVLTVARLRKCTLDPKYDELKGWKIDDCARSNDSIAGSPGEGLAEDRSTVDGQGTGQESDTPTQTGHERMRASEPQIQGESKESDVLGASGGGPVERDLAAGGAGVRGRGTDSGTAVANVGRSGRVHPQPGNRRLELLKYIPLAPVVVEAAQWFRNGDHPLDDVGATTFDPLTGEEYTRLEGRIVRFYRNPFVDGDTLCPRCDMRMHEHGWIENPSGGFVVCPGDWIVTGSRENFFYPMENRIFFHKYSPVNWSA